MAFNNDKHLAIINADTKSNKMALGFQRTPVKMYIPSGFSGTSVTFEIADTFAGSWAALKDKDNTAVTYTVTAGNWYVLEPKDFAGVENLQVVSSATETAKTVIILTGCL